MVERALEITLRKSPVSRVPKHRRTLEALGLSRPGRRVVKKDTPQIRGMVAQVSYLVEVREVEAPGPTAVKE
ncbi:50S ribosomal protein L30 [bacterium]|nr:50S ribosomal protein L30 [bacterium]